MSAGQSLAQRLKELEEKHGETVRVSEIAEVVQSVMDSLCDDFSTTDLKVFKELEALARYIDRAKAEIAALRPTDIPDTYIPTATDELDAIVGATEAATHKILDAAERMEGLQASLSGETAQALGEAVTQVYEACNFQDITGQRITKVVRALKHIEERVHALVAAFGPEVQKAEVKTSGPPREPKPATDADLLNGPQLPDAAKKQAEIDALLASFD